MSSHDPTTYARGHWELLPMVIIFASAIFALLALLFPVYIYRVHGFAVLPVRDSVGNVTGHVSYFLFSLCFSAFGLALCFFCYKMARWALSKRRDTTSSPQP